MSISSICHRLGVIEEEREEDERKLSVAIAAAERMNVLVRKTEKSPLSRIIQHCRVAFSSLLYTG